MKPGSEAIAAHVTRVGECVYVITEAKPPDTGFFLFSFGPDGRALGDTWHPTEDEAREQATFDSSSSDLTWRNDVGPIGTLVRRAHTAG
jgi:hypothetical protein